MKSFIALALLVSSVAHAVPAYKASCKGVDKVSGQQGVFTVLYGDYVRGHGYTSRELHVVSVGVERIDDAYNLEQRGFPTCGRNARKTFTELANGMKRFSASCNGYKFYDITGTCKAVPLF